MKTAETTSRSGIRLDRWLDIACLFKTRNQARDACQKGRVRVNGRTAKPSRLVAEGDRIEMGKSDWTRVVVVSQLPRQSVSREIARTLYEDLTPKRPPLDPVERLMRQSPAQRPPGMGRPSKRARRQQQRLRGR